MALLLLAALFLDECFSEVKRFHPLVGFGNYANFLEKTFYTNKTQWRFLSGLMCWCLAVLPIVCLSALLMWLLASYGPSWLYYVVSAVVLYFTIGQKSLTQHGQAVSKPLLALFNAKNSADKNEKIQQARYGLSMIVSRDTQNATPEQMATATIETVTENTHDAVIGPMVFFILLGVPGAVLFRLANTLDAMWGYRTERYEWFGKCAARMDDILGFIPARITSLLMAFASPRYFISTIKSIFLTGRRWYSPNAGLVMAAGAGALNIRLGGDAIYKGKNKTRLILGLDKNTNTASVDDIERSIKLMYKTSALLVFAIFVMELFTPYASLGVKAGFGL